MTAKTKNQESQEIEDRLLTSEERSILSQIATMEPPHSLRAQALLAIDEGATQAEAGRRAGLTFGQLRYWLDKFRKDRTSIFPEEMLNQAQQEDAGAPKISTEVQVESLDVAETDERADEPETQQQVTHEAKITPKKKAKKAKKSKKAKKPKKVKKPKKAKKQKKGKKSAKKTKKNGTKKSENSKGKSNKNKQKEE